MGPGRPLLGAKPGFLTECGASPGVQKQLPLTPDALAL